MHRYPDYPPEYDQEQCLVCGDIVGCDCPECPKCLALGSPHCYEQKHLELDEDSVGNLVKMLGFGDDIEQTFRTIERYADPPYALWIVLKDGQRFGSSSSEDTGKVALLPDYIRIDKIGVSAIAWDGTDWEFYEETEWQHNEGNKDRLDVIQTNLSDALHQHYVEEEMLR